MTPIELIAALEGLPSEYANVKLEVLIAGGISDMEIKGIGKDDEGAYIEIDD